MAIGTRRHRRTRWLLDADGLAVARGNWWRRETRVPASRVQHIDLKHGPLERRWRLSTVVVHTAGSKMGAVSLSGLDADDAEGLRDRLARQADDDDAS
jgi:membrane protein YdbS with pleckstrin-like domain